MAFLNRFTLLLGLLALAPLPALAAIPNPDPEDIDYITEHLPESGMDARFLALPWPAGRLEAGTWQTTVEAGFAATAASLLKLDGPMLAASAAYSVRDGFAVEGLAALGAEPPPDPWKQIEALLTEGQLAAAADAAAQVREEARKAGDEATWTRALIQETQLRVATSGHAEGYRVLRQAEWPRNLRDRAILHLYVAATLQAYAREFSWRVHQRERIDKPRDEGLLDLERATRGEILQALLAEAAEAWKARETLSDVQLSEVYRYLVPNGYPSEVRGTLRDAVSYRIAEVLADSAFWSVEEAQDLPRADLPRLIDGTVDAQPDDAAIHPLARMAAVLGDLESWHAAEGERAGALEARRERLRLLWSHFREDEDRRLLRRDLEERLPAFRDLPWWAMGMATLADFVRQEGDLPRARTLAREAAATWPKSPGGERALSLAEGIEAPLFTLSGMASDGPGRRSLHVEHKNLARLRFRAWPVDLAARVQRGQDTFPAVQEALAAGKPAVEWTSDLPPTPDFQLHQTYITPPIERPGAYLVAATPWPEPQEKDQAERLVGAVGIVLGDLVLSSQVDEPGSFVVTALSGSTGEPLPGVGIQAYTREGRSNPVPGVKAVTGPDGRARIALPEGSALLLARHGDDVSSLGAYFYGGLDTEASAQTLFFTDRSIYRPGQTVFWKALVYDSSAGREPVPASGRTAEIRLLDAHGETVASGSFTANEFGTAAGSFPLPAGRPLGSWSLTSSLSGGTGFRVEEYKRPTFEVTLDDPAEAVRLGRPATFSGKARYYFGLPVTDGRVSWRVVRETVWNERWRLWGWEPPWGGERVVATGTTTLDAEGAFRLSFTPAAQEGVATGGATWSFHIEAEVTEAAGETREAERRFRLGEAAVEAWIGLADEARFLLAGTPGVVRIARTSLDGVPRPGEGTWTLVALRQPEETLLPADQPLPLPLETDAGGYETPGDALRPREEPAYSPGGVLTLWEDGERIASGTARHKGDGRADVALPELAAGAYRLRYETVDDFGTQVRAQQEILVAGRKMPLALPLVLAVDRPRARAGETIHLLAHSGLRDQPLFLEIYSGGRLRERRALLSDRGPSLLEIPLRSEDRGGLGFKLVGVRDHQILSQATHVFVPWDNHELSVELATFREKIRPGARETWSVTVRTPREGGAEAAAAEVLASMYDRSLDLFQEHQLPDLLSLFPDRTSMTPDESSLGPAQVLAQPFQREWTWFEPQRDRLRLPGEGYGLPWYELLATPATLEDALRLEGRRTFAFGEKALLDERRISTGATVSQVVSEDLAMAPPPPPPPPPAPAPQQATQAPELRSDFRETAFWEPRLLTGPDGSAKIEFTVPDSVTSWSFWVQALTRDLRVGSLSRRVESVKELMVRPYLPRFLREGDRAELKVAVDNASAAPLSGEVELDVIDPETEESLLGAFGLTRETARLPFKAAAGGGTTVTFPLATPRRAGLVAFQVTAVTPGVQDGELRPLPILPARMHLAQSRYVALREPGSREMTFPDLARNDDPTRIDEQLVVTVDGQLFYGLLAALPYLVDYPYECTEQTLNRFVSTGILTSLFDRYPEVARMAGELAKREAPLETLDSSDPNRKMTLEETPWLAESRGLRNGDDSPSLRVLDPRVARAEQLAALDQLRKAQLPSGAFPWWPGGPESPYMTIYLLYGFAKGHEFGLQVPEDVIQRGWSYLGTWFKAERKDDLESCGCWPLATFLNYAASASPEEWTRGALSAEDRQEILKISWAHRFEMTPYLKAMLALTLHRMGRTADGRQVLTAALASTKTTTDEGTFWTEGEHGWLWYEDTVETHAFVLRAVQELLPEDPRRHGLVQWLFLNKQLSHWRSTRDTAEVIYAVAVYLEKEGQIGTREEATVRIGERRQDFVFEPDSYTGKENRIIVPGENVSPRDATIVVEKPTPGFLFAGATWHFSTEKLPEQGDGQLFSVDRRYFRRVKAEKETVLQPLETGDVLHPGDEVEVHLHIRSRVAAEYVHLRDPRPAGLEPEGAHSGWRWSDGAWWYEETRDSGMSFFFESLPAGEYTLKHRVRANMVGTFKAGPATIQSMYAPEHTAYSAGREVRVE